MQTFCLILQKIIKSKKIFSFGNEIPLFSTSHYHDDFIHLCPIIYSMINTIYKNNFTIWFFGSIYKKASLKYEMLKTHVIENNMVRNELKDETFDVFYKTQKIYFGFVKLLNMYKHKKYKIVVEDDLSGAPLNINDKHTFVLIQNSSKYLFSIRDLINIIETSLLNHYEFFAEPKKAKNPYNNIPFDYTTLCNIYFKMKDTTYFSHLFYLFFQSDFSLTDFKINNEPILRELSIKKFVYNSPPNILKRDIIQMLQEHYHARNWRIDSEFPLALFVDIFRPFLYNFLITFYNFRNLEKNAKCQDEWDAKLHRMYKDNSNFGVKMYKDVQIFNVIERKEVFNTNHINFYGKKIENYKFDKTWNIVPERKSMFRMPPISFLNQVINSLPSNSDNNEILYRTYDNMSPITIRNNPNTTIRRRRITPVASPSDVYSVESSISVEENTNIEDNNSEGSTTLTENINEEDVINDNYSEVSLTMIAMMASRNEEEAEAQEENEDSDIETHGSI
jgi:hypothetical protein